LTGRNTKETEMELYEEREIFSLHGWCLYSQVFT